MDRVTSDQPLSVKEAYDALDAFGRRAGRVPLLLLLHAAVPQSFRADLLNLLKVNFLAAEAGPDMTVDADVLLSGLVQPAAAGYYRLDPEVRRHCLELLDAAYRGRQQRRSVDVAWFLLAYADALERQAALALDALTAEYLAIQRWVALAFIDPASAAAAFAQALAGAVDGASPVAALGLGSITAAITIPLAGQEGLLAYARGLDALAQGDGERANRLLGWSGDDGLRVGGVTLRPGREVLTRFGAGSGQSAPPSAAADAATPEPRPVHVNLPPRMPTMLDRHAELAGARDLLLREGAPATDRPVVVDIKGQPGIGKWTLANAIVHDPAIVAAFPDGIVWLDEDSTEYPVRALEEYGKAVGAGDLLDGERIVQRERFKSVFSNRRVLIVAARRISDLLPLLLDSLGRRCVLLRIGPTIDVEGDVFTLEVSGLPAADIASLLPFPGSTEPVAELERAAPITHGNPLLARLVAPALDLALSRPDADGLDVATALSLAWPRLPAQARMVLEMVAERMPEHRTWFAKSELDDGLSPPVEQMLAGAPVDILGDFVRIHPLVREALPGVIAAARQGQASQRQEAERKERVFLSFALEDAKSADAILVSLKELGLETFAAETSVVPLGEEFKEAIEKAFREAGLLVPVLSKAAIATFPPYFRSLYATALDDARRSSSASAVILPVLVDDIDLSALTNAQIPLKLADIQWFRAPAGRLSDDFARAVHNAQAHSQGRPDGSTSKRDAFAVAIAKGDAALKADDNFMSAKESYAEAYGLATRRLQAEPADIGWQHSLASAAEKLGRVYRALREFDEAQRIYEDAIHIGQRPESGRPSATSLRDLWSLRQGLGSVYQATGRLDEALKEYLEALDIAERLDTLDPGEQARRDQVSSLTNVGVVHEMRGDLQEALKVHSDALTWAGRVEATDPSGRETQLASWVVAMNLGNVSRKLGDMRMAATYFERARGSAEPFVTADPADRQWAENLARSLQSLGDVYQDLKQTTEAARAHEQARAILDRLEGAAERQQTPVDPHLQDFAIVIDMDVAGNPERQQMMEEADAPTVYGWLTDAGGGDVPVDRVVAATARGYDYLSALFGNLATEVGRVRPDREPAEINRRFYVYVAGAVSMTPSGDVLLLVDPGATESTHFNITDASRRFSATGAFEEVVVWVDGLRDRSTGSSFLVSPPTVPEPQARRWFTAISIRDSGPSKRARGPRLSHWILEGLRGAARDSSTGQVTSESLGQFIRSRMPAAEDRGRPTILVQGNIVFAGASGRAPAR